MPSYLCISVRFLDATFHGRREADEPEWPPSPLRLFQALVAAAAARGRDSQHFPSGCTPAFEFLQALDAPIIITPDRHTGSPFRIAVPNNDLDTVAKGWAQRVRPKKEPAELKTMKTIRPTHLCNGDAVHYLWQLSDAACAECTIHKDVLFAAARSMVALGWGIDMVIGHGLLLTKEEADNLPGERWRPETGTSMTWLRTPQQGTLAALIARHEAFLNRLPPSGGFVPVPPLSAFGVVGYRRMTDLGDRPFTAFMLFQPDANKVRSFTATRAVAVAGMVRCLAGRTARQTGHCDPGTDHEQWVNEYVMGHGESEGMRARFSYLPVPSIRPPNVMIGISRLIVSEPLGSAGAHARWASRALRGQIIENEQGKEEALLVPLQSDGVLSRYVDQSDTWATVTPVVLPGCDDGKHTKAEKLFVKALHHAGYSSEALAELEFRNVSFWPGGELALKFQRPDYLKKAHWSVYHMRLRWRQPIRGPLALGAGRHCGLGIFAAMNE